jgi:3-dehydroquinate synthase
MKNLFSVTLENYTTNIYSASIEEIYLAKNSQKMLTVFDKNSYAAFASVARGDTVEIAKGHSLSLDAGETEKNFDGVRAILDTCFANGFSRKSVIAGIGGGVVTDIAAFAASIFMRGCALILVPTTLLAMVDAAIGGKSGINYANHKNMVGTFYPASKIYLVPQFLETLPERQLKSGLAEVIKHGMLGDEESLNIVEKEGQKIYARDIDLLSYLVERSLKVKCDIVEKDFREHGGRAFLNLGHTFAHALEAATSFSRYTHGEAVAWGIMCALDTGIAIGITDTAYRIRIERLLNCHFNLENIDASIPVSAILDAMRHDKKRDGETLQFVLQRQQGKTVITDVDPKIIEDVIKKRL